LCKEGSEWGDKETSEGTREPDWNSGCDRSRGDHRSASIVFCPGVKGSHNTYRTQFSASRKALIVPFTGKNIIL
jgi:hypothetical protein